jgi:hypothetical protein
MPSSIDPQCPPLPLALNFFQNLHNFSHPPPDLSSPSQHPIEAFSYLWRPEVTREPVEDLVSVFWGGDGGVIGSSRKSGSDYGQREIKEEGVYADGELGLGEGSGDPEEVSALSTGVGG